MAWWAVCRLLTRQFQTGTCGHCSREIGEETLKLLTSWSLMISDMGNRSACNSRVLLPCTLMTVSRLVTATPCTYKLLVLWQYPLNPQCLGNALRFLLGSLWQSVPFYHNCKVSVFHLVALWSSAGVASAWACNTTVCSVVVKRLRASIIWATVGSGSGGSGTTPFYVPDRCSPPPDILAVPLLTICINLFV